MPCVYMSIRCCTGDICVKPTQTHTLMSLCRQLLLSFKPSNIQTISQWLYMNSLEMTTKGCWWVGEMQLTFHVETEAVKSSKSKL